ncbi:MAG: glycosyltransferase family 4 protein, partial [Candidatus Njordarchaeales archaeon]
SAIIVPGKLSRSYVISLGANAEKVFIAPNTIDNELFIEISRKYQSDKERLKDKLGLKSKVLILCVGQLIRRKGIEYLLYAYGKLEQERDDIALVIVGSGPLEFHLNDLADHLRLKNFKLISSGLSLEELIKLYSATDIFVLPTLEDVWGFVINEAMACGLPVISTRASQAAVEMISYGENGYVVREADVETLFNSLKKLVCDGKLREKMGKKSRQILIQNFKIDHMVEGFMCAINWCTRTKIFIKKTSSQEHENGEKQH